MQIKRIVSQHRRDFTAIYECQFCGATMQDGGYDDTNFHENVLPRMKCKNCGKDGLEDENYRPLKTKYPDGYQV